jgi:hypothetical protein
VENMKNKKTYVVEVENAYIVKFPTRKRMNERIRLYKREGTKYRQMKGSAFSGDRLMKV